MVLFHISGVWSVEICSPFCGDPRSMAPYGTQSYGTTGYGTTGYFPMGGVWPQLSQTATEPPWAPHAQHPNTPPSWVTYVQDISSSPQGGVIHRWGPPLGVREAFRKVFQRLRRMKGFEIMDRIDAIDSVQKASK